MESEVPVRTPPAARGAEASLRKVDWWGFPALLKERDSKAYRPKALDERLRKERTRTEARLLVEARRLGVRTPILYDIDLTHHRLVMEELPGPTLKALIDGAQADPAALEAPLVRFGVAIGRLHAGGVTHGDLTSSNVIFPEGPGGPPALIDLSMGVRGPSLEELGIDLHLVEEDLKALHPQGEELFQKFLTGYAEGNPGGHREVEERAKEIRGRVRYA
ncbi:MAG: Kae1-associated serine/threonine protein kinase [Thermoplasmata archaeon]|nr:Kae1-associated serine/threonine protein kinase [Thermoplasmata archaeon]